LEQLRIFAIGAVRAMLRRPGYPPDEVQDCVDELQVAIDSLSSPPPPPPSSSLPPANLLPIAQAMRVWVQQSPPRGATKQDERNLQFAQYCASSAVVDERVLELQLMHCDNVRVGEKIRAIFSRKQDVIAFLLERPAASAVIRALQPHAATSPDVFALFDVVRKLDSVVDIDKDMLYDTWGFFFALLLSRHRQVATAGASELHLTAILAYCAMAPFMARDDTFMNQGTFTRDQMDQLERLYNEQLYIADFGVVNDNNDDNDDEDYIADDTRSKTDSTRNTKTRYKKLRRPDLRATKEGRTVLVGEVKPKTAPDEDVYDDQRRLVYLARTFADVHAAASQAGVVPPAPGVSMPADVSSAAPAATTSSQSSQSSRSSVDGSAVLSSRGGGKRGKSGGTSGGGNSGGGNSGGSKSGGDSCQQPETSGAASSSQLRASATASCHIGAFTLQVVGCHTVITLLMQVHQSFYVNLELLTTDLATCSMKDAINYLALMVAIRSTARDFDRAITGKLFANEEWNQLDAAIAKTTSVPAPSPSNRQLASGVAGQQGGPSQRGQRGGQPTAHDVALGALVVDHDDRAVVRSADGDVAFKVLLTETGAARARSEAAHELRVHKLLSRRAAAHVVPLLVHIEALVALPGQEWWQSRGSIVLVMPWCEQVNASELHDVSEVARCVEALLGALRALHRLGVLHGDVKWSNTLWLCEQKGELRRLVLSDFGLAQQLDVDGRATLQRGVGTEDYMAPEVRRGSALFVSAAADVYSAGVALRKLPAYAVCEAMRALVSLMCAEQSNARLSACGARRMWVRTVVPALQATLTQQEAPQLAPHQATPQAMSQQTQLATPQPTPQVMSQAMQLATPQPTPQAMQLATPPAMSQQAQQAMSQQTQQATPQPTPQPTPQAMQLAMQLATPPAMSQQAQQTQQAMSQQAQQAMSQQTQQAMSQQTQQAMSQQTQQAMSQQTQQAMSQQTQQAMSQQTQQAMSQQTQQAMSQQTQQAMSQQTQQTQQAMSQQTQQAMSQQTQQAMSQQTQLATPHATPQVPPQAMQQVPATMSRAMSRAALTTKSTKLAMLQATQHMQQSTKRATQHTLASATQVASDEPGVAKSKAEKTTKKTFGFDRTNTVHKLRK
jgi:serine/threonine protein kinase